MSCQAAGPSAVAALQNLRLSRFAVVRSAKPRPQTDAKRLANLRALREMERFRLALSSYPARFAQDPNVTFAMHCRTVMAGRTGH
jgi:hypothetical protein